MLDDYIDHLQLLRERVGSGKPGELKKHMEGLIKDLEQWRLERHQADWKTVEFGKSELPKAGDILKQQVGGLDRIFGRGRKKDKTE